MARGGGASISGLLAFFEEMRSKEDAMLLVSFLEPPPHIVLSSTRALVEQICSLLLSQGREQLPQRPPSLLGSINLRDAARSPTKNKKNSRPKKKKNVQASSSPRAAVAVRGVKVDAPINALDYDELTEVIR